MKNDLTKNELFEELCEHLYKARQQFVNVSLKHLIAFKVYIGRRIMSDPLYRSYGDNLIEAVMERTGFGKDVLYEAVKMYKIEELSEKKEIKFIKTFIENYSSWNDYREKKLGMIKRFSTTSRISKESNRCNHSCPSHCT